ncbi:MAG TPA: hypothetical protein DCR14_07990 [Acidimicrobiaceae bacterium]|nr:hypothetical protein [Acidimicrobiaceae bacterium]
MDPYQLHDLFAWVAVALFVGVLALAVVKILSFAAPRPGVFSVLGAVHKVQLPAAAAVATVTSLGSFWFSEFGDKWLPCRFCWYQRIFMYSAAVILIIAALRRDRGIKWYAGPLAGIGILISSYHILLEHGLFEESAECSATVPCALPYHVSIGSRDEVTFGPANWYSVTMATMAFIAFAAILALLFLPEALDESDSTQPTSDTEDNHGEPQAG